MGSGKSLRAVRSIIDSRMVSRYKYDQLVGLYVFIAANTLPDTKSEYAYGEPFVFKHIKELCSGEYPVYFRHIYKVKNHIERAYDSGYTKNEIVFGYQLKAEKEENEIIRKVGIEFIGLEPEKRGLVKGHFQPTDMGNGSLSIGRVKGVWDGWTAQYDILIPSPKTIERYYIEEHDEELISRKTPFMATHSGDKCPICRRYISRGKSLSDIYKWDNESASVIPEYPSKYIRCCNNCLGFFSELIESGRYWCFECGKVERFDEKNKCSYSKDIKKQHKRVEKIKEQDRIDKEEQERADKLAEDWGI